MSVNAQWSALQAPLPDNLDAAIPQALRDLDRWVVWRYDRHGKKPPFSPVTRRPIDITDPHAGATFAQAIQATKTGKFNGVGFIFNGDGLTGIDIDDCLSDPDLRSAAIGLLLAIGCRYVEISPSGNGLHGIGWAKTAMKNVTGRINGLSVELYSHARYFTFTGHWLPSYPNNGKIVTLQGLPRLHEALLRSTPQPSPPVPTQETQETKDTQATQDTQETHFTQERQAGGGHVSCPASLPSSCIPSGYGTRNRAVFALARYYRSTFAELDYPISLRPRVQEWFNTYRDRFRTQDFEATWVDFVYAWHNIDKPYGDTLAEILVTPVTVPEWMHAHGLGARGDRLLEICVRLAAHHHPEPFFLSSRMAGQMLGLDHSDAAKLLKAMVYAGLLILVKPGVRSKASLYRLADPPSW